LSTTSRSDEGHGAGRPDAQQDDADVHLILQDAAGHTMIAEVPTASCISGATAYRRHQMEQARAEVKLAAPGSGQVGSLVITRPS
jgi:hypothetical protein